MYLLLSRYWYNLTSQGQIQRQTLRASARRGVRRLSGVVYSSLMSGSPLRSSFSILERSASEVSQFHATVSMPESRHRSAWSYIMAKEYFTILWVLHLIRHTVWTEVQMYAYEDQCTAQRLASLRRTCFSRYVVIGNGIDLCKGNEGAYDHCYSMTCGKRRQLKRQAFPAPYKNAPLAWDPSICSTGWSLIPTIWKEDCLESLLVPGWSQEMQACRLMSEQIRQHSLDKVVLNLGNSENEYQLAESKVRLFLTILLVWHLIAKAWSFGIPKMIVEYYVNPLDFEAFSVSYPLQHDVLER